MFFISKNKINTTLISTCSIIFFHNFRIFFLFFHLLVASLPKFVSIFFFVEKKSPYLPSKTWWRTHKPHTHGKWTVNRCRTRVSTPFRFLRYFHCFRYCYFQFWLPVLAFPVNVPSACNFSVEMRILRKRSTFDDFRVCSTGGCFRFRFVQVYDLITF